MILYPSIDLLNDHVVRLYQGQFPQKTIYNSPAAEVLQQWSEDGATHVHIVDLEGAKGHSKQKDLVARLLQDYGEILKIQIAGGIRSAQDVQAMLALGAHRVVLGSMVVEKPAVVHHIIKKYTPERITLACDVISTGAGEMLQTRGWQKSSQKTLSSVVEEFASYDIPILVTDISKDGTMQGPGFAIYSKLKTRYPKLQLIISGGISGLKDLQTAQTYDPYACIIGKALHENTFSLKEALACVSS